MINSNFKKRLMKQNETFRKFKKSPNAFMMIYNRRGMRLIKIKKGISLMMTINN
eukprot:SAG22_NODE_817_length_7026_cov_13.636206_4_plen_54_part_00